MADEGGVIDLCDSDEEERRYTEEMEALGWAAPTPTPSGAAAAASAGGSGGEGKENIQQQLQPPQQQPVRPTTASSSTSSASASASSGSSYRPSQDSEDGGGGKGSKPKPKPAKATTKAAAADEDSSSVEDPEDKKEELSDEQRGILRHVMSGAWRGVAWLVRTSMMAPLPHPHPMHHALQPTRQARTATTRARPAAASRTCCGPSSRARRRARRS